METSTNTVVENKLEPIAKQDNVGPQMVITGQYLMDTFVATDEQQITKMQLIRRLSEIADALQIKGACDKMVELAVLIDYPQGKPKKADRLTKEQTAMNARTVIQQAWGALKFAPDNLVALGYSERTGYQDMRVIAKRALDAAQVSWKGEPVKTDAEKEVARLKAAQKAETTALVEVQKDNPRLLNESLQEWQTRTMGLALDAMEEAREKADNDAVQKVLSALVEKHDDNRLYLIAVALFDHLGLEVNQPEPEEEKETEMA